jgi:Mrp family chromosome partitioning ATPase
MSDVLARLAGDHDVVVIDAAPLLPVTDAAVLARITSATLLVGDGRRIRRAVLGQALTLLERAEARVAGVVLTHRRQRIGDAYGYAQHEPVTQPAAREAPAGIAGAGTATGHPRPTTPATR